jgi:hypothetical protein
MALERLLESARGRIPEPYSFIIRAGCQQPAIGGEGHRPNRVCMALERLQFCTPVLVNLWEAADPVRKL